MSDNEWESLLVQNIIVVVQLMGLISLTCYSPFNAKMLTFVQLLACYWCVNIFGLFGDTLYIKITCGAFTSFSFYIYMNILTDMNLGLFKERD